MNNRDARIASAVSQAHPGRGGMPRKNARAKGSGGFRRYAKPQNPSKSLEAD